MIEEIIIDKIDEINEEYNVIVRNSPDNGYKLENINILSHQKEAMNKVLNELLIEFKNKPDYKSAWENLKRQGFNRSSDIVAHDYLKDMQELEQKYNIGDKNE